MPLDPSFVEHLAKSKVDVAELEKLASARDGLVQRQPKWERSKALKYVKDGVTVMAGATQAQRNVARFVDEGQTKMARVGYCPFLRMIDPSGNVCSVAISNNRHPSGAKEKYASQIERWKLESGWLHFDEVPDSRSGCISRNMEEWRLEREHVIRHRKALAGIRSADFAEIYKSQEERVMERAASAVAAPIQSLVEGMSKMMQARGPK
jgi:hypothetical protein